MNTWIGLHKSFEFGRIKVTTVLSQLIRPHNKLLSLSICRAKRILA